MAEDVTVRINADTQPFQDALQNLEKLSASFGSQLTGALKSAAFSGKELDDILRRIGLNLAGMALEQGLKQLQSLAGSLFSNLLGGLTGLMPFAKGGVPGHVVPFASGGVVSAPSYFPLGRNIGVMGEAGPEAILPLQRSADGRLGVASAGGGGNVNVVFNVTTPDASSFRKSEAQVTGMLARAVSRGARTF
ncbi:MAG: phage tail tape measure protein [Mesorhizobium sp.]|nr:phage tail tape measure protein [Mesorhizobium sp.]MBL8579009.1 phage tail tape measure protein [Mesorhizobium sp.]